MKKRKLHSLVLSEVLAILRDRSNHEMTETRLAAIRAIHDIGVTVASDLDDTEIMEALHEVCDAVSDRVGQPKLLVKLRTLLNRVPERKEDKDPMNEGGQDE